MANSLETYVWKCDIDTIGKHCFSNIQLANVL